MIGLEWICSELPDHHPAAQPKVGERRAAAAPAPQPMTDGEAPDIGAMSVKELRAHIAAAGLSCLRQQDLMPTAAGLEARSSRPFLPATAGHDAYGSGA